MFAIDPILQPVFNENGITLLECDVIDGLNSLAPNSVDAMCLSNPYHFMVGYKESGQHGLEPTLQAYLEVQTGVAIAALRPLKEHCIMAVVLGDTTNQYSPARDKDHKRATGQWVGRRPLEPDYWLQSEDKAVPWRYAIELNATAGFRYLGYRMWDKCGQGNRKTKLGDADGEPILFFVKQSRGPRLKVKHLKPFDSMFLRHKPVSDDVHRCPYPESLATEILEHIAAPGHLIVDFYCGTGTTGRASQALGMNFLGIDLNCQRAIELTQSRFAEQAKTAEAAAIEAAKPAQLSLITVGKRSLKKPRGIPRGNPGSSSQRQFPACGWVEEDTRDTKTKGRRTKYYYRWEASGSTFCVKLQDFDHAQKVRELIRDRKPVADIRTFLKDFD